MSFTNIGEAMMLAEDGKQQIAQALLQTVSRYGKRLMARLLHSKAGQLYSRR